MRVLLVGWFSFEYMGATAGDLVARDLVAEWLTEAGIDHDVANIDRFAPGVDWQRVDPASYSHVIFVCGPMGNGPPLVELFERFEGRSFIGLDVTMLDPIEEWNPFDLLIERDSSRVARPDLTFSASLDQAPAIALVLVHPQSEYGPLGRHDDANEALESLAVRHECARFRVDTQLDIDENPLRTPSEVTGLLARADVILTTRLHGLALGLHLGVPVIAVDPIAGGAKVSRQAESLGWPHCYHSEVAPSILDEAFDFCLSEGGQRLARDTADRARQMLRSVPAELFHYLGEA